MTTRIHCLPVLAGILGAALPAAFAARVNPDLPTPQKRQASVATAERLAEKLTPPPLGSGLVSPFNPAGFDQTEAGSAAAAPVARGGAATPAAPRVLTARETLELLAAQITPTGMIMMRDTPRLIIGGKPFEVGTRFTASYNNQDYELELVAIDRTTFTLRHRGEDITRPIKPVR
jgi:hypothetical protein